MFDINKVLVTGKIVSVEMFKTKKEVSAMNLQLKSENRYSDVIGCVAYGPTAEAISKTHAVGDDIMISGRLMSLLLKDGKTSTLRVVIEKIGKETYSLNESK